MRELSENANPGTDPAVTINILSGMSTLRMQSWMLEHIPDDRPVSIAGCDLPRSIGTVQAGEVRLLCVGPSDWVAVGSGSAIARFQEKFAAPLRAQGIAATDLSCAQAQVRISGPAARDLLSKGCGLDLHSHNFPTGRCARTRFAQLAVVIESCGGAAHFVVHVPRSYLAYLYCWLADASLEFEMARQ